MRLIYRTRSVRVCKRNKETGALWKSVDVKPDSVALCVGYDCYGSEVCMGDTLSDAFTNSYKLKEDNHARTL